MRTGLPAALLRGTPSAKRDDRFTRCPFPAATTHAPVALARSSNTAMEHRNRCTDLRHPELLATSLLKCPRQDCCETPSETKKIGKLSPLSSFIFLTLRDRRERGALHYVNRILKGAKPAELLGIGVLSQIGKREDMDAPLWATVAP